MPYEKVNNNLQGIAQERAQEHTRHTCTSKQTVIKARSHKPSQGTHAEQLNIKWHEQWHSRISDKQGHAIMRKFDKQMISCIVTQLQAIMWKHKSKSCVIEVVWLVTTTIGRHLLAQTQLQSPREAIILEPGYSNVAALELRVSISEAPRDLCHWTR